MQLCDMSVSNPLVPPIHNGTTYVNMVMFCRMGACVVDVKQLLDENLTTV